VALRLQDGYDGSYQTVLKITASRENEKSLTVRLCGQLTREYLVEVERTLAGESTEAQTVRLDLANVTFVDREAMVFLCAAKARNIAIENCPSYVVRWIQQERLCGTPVDDPTEK
jgi:ABC-type transporter Mla MlaB component